mgnify:CR=1 FL=1
MGGYFKLYRELFKKPIWLNSSNEQRVILITLLAMANWKETEWDYFGEKIILKPGQFVTSLQKIVEQCKAEGVEANKQITVQNVRTMLQKCERLNFLTVRLTGKSTKSGRLITIVNWRVYQGEEPTVNKEINKEPNSQLTNNQQRANKEPNKHIKEEYKELEEDKESIRNHLEGIRVLYPDAFLAEVKMPVLSLEYTSKYSYLETISEQLGSLIDNFDFHYFVFFGKNNADLES